VYQGVLSDFPVKLSLCTAETGIKGIRSVLQPVRAKQVLISAAMLVNLSWEYRVLRLFLSVTQQISCSALRTLRVGRSSRNWLKVSRSREDHIGTATSSYY